MIKSTLKPDVASDPRVSECVQLVRGFAETVFTYVESVTGREMSRSAIKATDHLETVLRSRIEGMVSDHVSRAVEHIASQHPQGGLMAYTLRFPQRKKHLLRMLSCSYSDLVATDGKLRNTFPKIILNGMESWLTKALGAPLFKAANVKALEALGAVTNENNIDNDNALWMDMLGDPASSTIYYTVAIPLVMHFSHDFERGRGDMQRIISSQTNGIIALTAGQWNELFFRLFGPLFYRLGVKSEQARIDQAFEPGTALKLARIYSEYKKWLKANQLQEPKLASCAPCKPAPQPQAQAKAQVQTKAKPLPKPANGLPKAALPTKVVPAHKAVNAR